MWEAIVSKHHYDASRLGQSEKAAILFTLRLHLKFVTIDVVVLIDTFCFGID